MTKRLQILKSSLEKKEQQFDARLDAHIADVKRANGQPLNDKRNGHVTLNRWERQEDSLRNAQKGIRQTKQAIEREEGKIFDVDCAKSKMPAEIIALIESGELKQWRKFPHILFVDGVDKARIYWDAEAWQVSHKFYRQVADLEQRKKFATVYNALNTAINESKSVV